MNHYCSRVETLPDGKRALEELRSIQKIRVKTKMTSKVDIGDGITTIIFANSSNTYTGNIKIESIEGDVQIAVYSEGEKKMVLPCDQIQSCSIINTTVNLQLREDYYAQKCVLELYNEEQVQMIQSKLPPIKRPEAEDNVIEVSSDSDFNDSGNDKTIMDNSFDSTKASEHE